MDEWTRLQQDVSDMKRDSEIKSEEERKKKEADEAKSKDIRKRAMEGMDKESKQQLNQINF